MKFSSIGKNIRKYRLAKRMTQDELAEKTGLSVTYIGMLERGEKLPAIDTFIDILNALEVSADMILNEVVATGYKVKASVIADELELLSEEDRARIYDVIETLVKHSKKKTK